MPVSAAERRRSLLRTFFRCFLMAFVMFLPFLIIDKGFFLYCGDFNSQQIPFTYYLEGMLQKGLPTYSWATDLGTGFWEGYSFYLVGSPFFWLGRLLPQAWSPYLMVPLLCLKLAVAGTGACLWARRYTRTTYAAELVAILYAFSGFSIYNIFFNHFVDVVALFPFLLWSVDEFYDRDRRGLFAVMVTLCLFVNYFFFVGQVVFIVLYFVLRLLGDDWRPSLRKFGVFCFEALLGVGMAMVLALPSIFAVLRNPRVDSFSAGLDLVIYWRTQQYLAIFTSLFLPQDPSYLPNLFPDCSIKWTSMSAYLPLTGMAGVLVWMRSHKKSTLHRLLVTCAVMALVPILNAAFYAFNSSYYCRWYYMPVLVMALVTAQALEEAPRSEWLRCTRVCGLITAAYVLFALLPAKTDDGGYKMGVEDDPLRFGLTLALALGSVCLLYFLLKRCRSRAGLLLRVSAFAAMFGVVIGIYTIACGKFPQRDGDADYKLECYDYRSEIADWLDSADSNYYRIDTYESYTNLGLWLNRSCIQFFNSTVDASILEFYPMVGVKRDVSSKPELEKYMLRGLLNVKYILMPTDRVGDFNDKAPYAEDWTFVRSVGPYSILQYNWYVPFGTTYDYYITQAQYESLSETNRANILMRALVLSDEQIERYGSMLDALADSSLRVNNYTSYTEDCTDRRARACSSFVTDDRGFTAEISVDSPELVFFSVPYNKGWQATVNGEKAVVEQVDDGLCAVAVGAGDSEIRFGYMAPGMAEGEMISLACVLVFCLYVLILLSRRLRAARAGQLPAHGFLLEMTPAEEADALPVWREAEPAAGSGASAAAAEVSADSSEASADTAAAPADTAAVPDDTAAVPADTAAAPDGDTAAEAAPPEEGSGDSRSDGGR